MTKNMLIEIIKELTTTKEMNEITSKFYPGPK